MGQLGRQHRSPGWLRSPFEEAPAVAKQSQRRGAGLWGQDSICVTFGAAKEPCGGHFTLVPPCAWRGRGRRVEG